VIDRDKTKPGFVPGFVLPESSAAMHDDEVPAKV
jgi:hypothetical protein